MLAVLLTGTHGTLFLRKANDDIRMRNVVVIFLDGEQYDFRNREERSAAVKRALHTGIVFGSFDRTDSLLVAIRIHGNSIILPC